MEDEFSINKSDLKHYPHFDAPISLKKINKLVQNPNLVAQNSFFPFIRYEKSWQPFRSKSLKPKTKKRLIRYSARRDAYIYTYYRRKLSVLYEDRLKKYNINDCPIAYRKIPINRKTDYGKCNINFAKDAFDYIRSIGNCVTIALDISGFFENLDHTLIKKQWQALLNESKLPPDHYAIYKSITNYSFVDKKELYERLGYFGNIKLPSGKTIRGYLVPKDKVPTQLCDLETFRDEVCGKNPKFKPIIQTNSKTRGIPQGAPISDLIANFYLFDFDIAINKFAKKHNGKYWRYSDDILLVIPYKNNIHVDATKFALSEITKHGKYLKIKKSKTSVVRYDKSSKGLKFTHIEGKQGKNGLEYLGFRFDGRSIFLRDGTVSGFYRKLTAGARKEATTLLKRNPKFTLEQLQRNFNYTKFHQKYSKVSNFDEISDQYKKWTFWTYVKRSAEIFKPDGDQILKQMSKHKKNINMIIKQEILKSYRKLNSIK